MRGKNKPSKRVARKQHNVIDEARDKFEEKRLEGIENDKGKKKAREDEIFYRDAPVDALDRFKKH